jgi:hypothetical protein
MSSSESGVLFVNKCAKSKCLSRSNGLERARIFSHVQRNPQSQPAKPSTPPGEQTHGPGTAVVWQIAPSRNAPVRSSQSKPQCKPRRNERAQEHCSSSSSGCSSGSSTDIHSPLSTIGLALFDPFETTAAPITPYMNRILEFCKQTVTDVDALPLTADLR